jgi:hypothetical protein
MTASPRRYLAGRFRADAEALHQRASALGAAPARGGPPRGGPDAAMSTRMAVACETVVALVEGVPSGAAEGEGLAALIPVLEARAAAHLAEAPVRAVYVGAATRVREVLQAAHGGASGATDDDDAEADDADDDDDGALADGAR